MSEDELDFEKFRPGPKRDDGVEVRKVGIGRYHRHVTHGAGWTDERVEELKALWKEGLSASQIARAMGGGLTRSGVVGKISRLGLTGQGGRKAHHTGTPRVQMKSVRPPKSLPPEPAPELPPLTLENGNHVTLVDLTSRTCRWPIGHPNEAEFHFCGHKPKLGSPYCEAHMRRAYQPAQVRAATDRYLTRKPKWA